MTTYIGKYLNPGEVENLIKTERDERRKRRLNQVRQQAREKASKIVLSVKKERDRQLQMLSNRLKADWLKSKEEQVEELGQIYGKNLISVGAAHSNIVNDIIAKEAHTLKKVEDCLKAATRGETALQDVKIKQFKEAENVIKQDARRKAVRNSENERAQQISGLPPPPPLLSSSLPLPLIQKDKSDISEGNKRIQTHSMRSPIQRGTLLPENDFDLVKVIKVTATNEMDAHEAAKLDNIKQVETTEKKLQKKMEQRKKERTRFLKAKSQLELHQDYNRIMNELEELVKQEEVCSESDLVLGMEKENTMLKEEQEAIVEELFSRLGLALADSSTVEKKIEDFSSTNFESKSGESTIDTTPVVHVIAHDSSSAISHILDSSRNVRTGESSLGSGTTISSDIYTNSYPMDSKTSTRERSSEWNERTPVNATVERYPTSGSTVTTNDETILAGHFHDHALDSSTNILTLPSLDSSDSKVSPSASHLLSSLYQPSTHEKNLKDMNSAEHLEKMQDNSFKLNSQEIVPLESAESKQKYHDFAKSSSQQEEKQRMQTLSYLDRDNATKYFKDDIKDLQNGKPNIMDDKLRRLALTNLLANKNLKTKAKSLNSEFCEVEVKQTDRKEGQKLLNKSSIDSSTGISDAPPLGHFYFRPTQVKTNLGKMETVHDLSTIMEMDTPGSSQHTCWQNSSTFSISKELESSERFDPHVGMNEPGITDEPDLTLVGSECSTCSPNRSHVYDAIGITPSTESFFNMLDIRSITDNSLEDQNEKEIRRHKRSAFLMNSTNGRDKNGKITDSGGHSFPLLQELSHFLKNLSSGGSPSLDSYSTSVGNSAKDWSTPTISSSDSHSCFSTNLQQLSDLSTPNIEFLLGSNPPSFFMHDSNPSEIKSQVPSFCEELVVSGLPRTYLASALDSTMENCTDSLMSFMLHERNADMANLSTLDTICTDADTFTGESPSDSKSSNGNDAHQRYFSSHSESMSDSMFSFLRHEVSADNSSYSGISELPPAGNGL